MVPMLITFMQNSSPNHFRLIKKVFVIAIVLFPLFALGQQRDSLSLLVNKLQTVYAGQSFRIHLALSQPKYSPGDTIFFKGCLIEFQNTGLVKDKEIIIVSLEGVREQPLYERVLFKDGWGSGHLIIPKNFRPAIYRLVAFPENHISENGVAMFPFESQLVIAGKQGFRQDLHAVPSDSGDISISVMERDASLIVGVKALNNHLAGKPLYIVLNKYNEVYHSEKFILPDSLVYYVTVPREQMKSGIFRIAIFSSKLDLMVDRVIQLDRHTNPVMELLNIKGSYNTRDSVNIAVRIKNRSEIRNAMQYAVSVFNEDMLSSDSVKIPKFKTNDTPGISWRQVLKPQILIPKTAPNYFRGTAVFSDTGQPVPDSTLLTFYLHENDFFYGLYTGKDGKFVFPLFKNFGDEEIFFAADYKGKPIRNVRLNIWSYQPHFEKLDFAETGDPDRYGIFSNYRSLINRSYRYYSGNKAPEIIDNSDDIAADYEVNMRKFETFHSMGEVLSNIVSMVKYQENNGLGAVRIFMKKSSNYAKDNPVYIIDGVMTDNTDYFLSLDPSQVLKIKILRTPEKLSRYGIIGRNGVVIVSTRIQDHNLKIPRTEKTVFVKGINQPLPFTNVLHDANQLSPVPDLRTLLYWDNRTLELSSSPIIRFFTSDAVGRYRVRIEGILDHGEFFVFEDVFNVNFKPAR
jgi:hypothetical protein